MTDHDPSLSPDAHYIPFPRFRNWPRTALATTTRRLAEKLQEARGGDPKVFREAIQFSLRVAAFDTGALEALYSTDRGLTFSVAAQAEAWQAEVNLRNGDALAFFDAQLQTYELVLDAVTGEIPISEAWIRRLHEEICRSQENYTVQTPQGAQPHKLSRGEYKKESNHVLEADGTLFAFAPVRDTPREMHRLVEELRSEVFQEANHVDQAAYAHYSFVRIHPFADGNGRVARALASLFLYRGFSVPLVILAGQRDEYLAALKSADRGQAAAFSDFMQRRVAEALELVLDRVGVGPLPSTDELIKALSLGRGTAGSTSISVSSQVISEEARSAGESLVQLAFQALSQTREDLPLPSSIEGRIRLLPPKMADFKNDSEGQGSDDQHLEDQYLEDQYLEDQARILLRFSNNFPPELEASVEDRLALSIAEGGNTVRLIGLGWQESFFEISTDQLSATQRSFVGLKLASWADRLVRKALDELNRQVQRQLAELSS